MTSELPSFDNRSDARKWMCRELARYSDSVLALAVRAVAREVMAMMVSYGGNYLPVIQPQSRWDAMEAITCVAMERFDRVPDSPNDLLIEELASATWCVIHVSWASHDYELARWPLIYGRMLAADVAVTEAMVQALPPDTVGTVADPLDEYPADVCGGYVWHRDRAPEPA